MKKFDDKARLGHIFDAISAIEKYVAGVESWSIPCRIAKKSRSFLRALR